jgi:hypothetical protein
VAEPAYTDAQLDAAVAQLEDSERLRAAQDLVARAAPQLQRVLNAALSNGGWFGDIHDQAVHAAAAEPELAQRKVAVSTLVAEETRLGMLVGVAVGYELARILEADDDTTSKGE